MQREMINMYFESTPFERQLDGVPNWLHVHKKFTYYPSWHNDFRKFHKEIQPEILKILEKESKVFSPLRFNLEFVRKSKKYTMRKETILVKVFDRRTVSKMLDMLLEEQLEELAKQSQGRLNIFHVNDRRFVVPHKCGPGSFTDSVSSVYLRVSN